MVGGNCPSSLKLTGLLMSLGRCLISSLGRRNGGRGYKLIDEEDENGRSLLLSLLVSFLFV